MPLNGHLTDLVKTVRVMNGVVAGTSDQTSSAVRLSTHKADAARFVILLGALTATQVTSAKLQQSSDDGSSDAYSDLEGTLVGPMADDDDDQMLIIDVIRPTKDYLKCVVDRGTANAVIDGIICELYQLREVPVASQDATVMSAEKFVGPAEGTA